MLKNKVCIVLIVVSFCWFFPSKTWGWYRLSARLNLVGKIIEIKPRINLVYIENILDKHVNYFYIPSYRLSKLEEGDEVRIYYYYGSREVLSVVKMTPLEYGEGQNKGYITYKN